MPGLFSIMQWRIRDMAATVRSMSGCGGIANGVYSRGRLADSHHRFPGESSMQRLSVRLLVLICALGLSACAKRGAVGMVSPQTAEAAGAAFETVFVATDRVYSGGPDVYSRARAENPSFARYQIAIPASHQPGKIEWPAGTPDPTTDMVAVEEEFLSLRMAERQINARLARLPADKRIVTIYVHGFNTNYPESFYRMAQMMHDLEIEGEGIAYSWASAGNAFGYVYDRDSAAFARDGLVQLLAALERTRATKIRLVAHSLGGYLTMESLRQMALTGAAPPWGKLSTVVLMSPDIDVQLFREQARAIGDLPETFVIFVSSRDRALALSAGVTGTSQRLGNIRDLSLVEEFDIVIIDLSAVTGGDAMNHMTAATSPETIALIDQIREFSDDLDAAQLARQGLIPGTIKSVQNITEIVVNPLSPQ
jgi:esterase/lipase superfamily enzyme